MNGANPHKTPADALRAHLEELGGLRNANARDQVFKTWRQNTLTLIQRVWSHDPARAERFRRIPFSTSSGKATTAAARQQFERGCSEAIWLLRDWIEDARRHDRTFEHASGAATPALPGSQEDDFPVLDLPVDGSTAAQVGNSAVNTTPLGPDAPISPSTPPRGPGVRSEAPPPPLVSPFAEPIELPPAPPRHEPGPKPAKPTQAAKPARKSEAAKTSPAAKDPQAPRPAGPAKPAPAKATGSAKPADARKPEAPAKPIEFLKPPGPAKPIEPVKPATPAHPVAQEKPVVSEPAAAPAAPEPDAGSGYEADLDAAFDLFMGPGSERTGHGAGKRPPGPKRALKEMLGFTEEAHAPATPIEFARAPEPVAEVPPGFEAPALDASSRAAFDAALPSPPEAWPAEHAPPQSETWSVEDPQSAKEPLPFDRGADVPFGGGVGPGPIFDESDLPEFEIVSEDFEPAGVVAEVGTGPAAASQPTPAEPTPAPEPEVVAAEVVTAASGSDAADEAEMADFLSRSPVLGASPKPARPRALQVMRSPVAVTLSSFASEVAHLGVPEGQRAAARATLLELARAVEEGHPSWEAVRVAVAFVMEHPPLARRVLPLLIPYLDQAA